MAEYAAYPQEIFQLKGRAYELQLIRWEMQLWKELHILGAEFPCAVTEKKITIGNIWVLLWILLEPERFTQDSYLPHNYFCIRLTNCSTN